MKTSRTWCPRESCSRSLSQSIERFNLLQIPVRFPSSIKISVLGSPGALWPPAAMHNLLFWGIMAVALENCNRAEDLSGPAILPAFFRLNPHVREHCTDTVDDSDQLRMGGLEFGQRLLQPTQRAVDILIL